MKYQNFLGIYCVRLNVSRVSSIQACPASMFWPGLSSDTWRSREQVICGTYQRPPPFRKRSWSSQVHFCAARLQSATSRLLALANPNVLLYHRHPLLIRLEDRDNPGPRLIRTIDVYVSCWSRRTSAMSTQPDIVDPTRITANSSSACYQELS